MADDLDIDLTYDEAGEQWSFEISGKKPQGYKFSNFTFFSFNADKPFYDRVDFVRECRDESLKLGIPVDRLYEEFEDVDEFKEALRFVCLGVLQ